MLRGIGVPRTTVGRLSVGLRQEGLSTASGLDGASRGLASAGARSRNKVGMAGGGRLLTDEGTGAVRLGGVRPASESVLFLAFRGDSLKATFRITATAARDSAAPSFRRSLQLVHCPVNFVGSLMLRNSSSGRSCLQARQLRTARSISSSIYSYLAHLDCAREMYRPRGPTSWSISIESLPMG